MLSGQYVIGNPLTIYVDVTIGVEPMNDIVLTIFTVLVHINTRANWSFRY